MTRPKPRNDGPRPTKVTAGSRQRGGQMTAWEQGQRVGFNAAHLTGVSVEMDRAEAVEFCHKLARLLGLE